MIKTAVESATVVRRLEPFEFADPRQGWNLLAGETPFRRLSWLKSWFDAYGDDGRISPYVLACERDGVTIGLLPCVLERDLIRGRTLRFLGSGTVCTDYLSILCRPEHEEAVVEAFADELAYRAAGTATERFDAVELDGFAENDPALAQLTERLRERGFEIDRKPIERSWRLALPETWEGYLATLSKSHRKQIRRLTRDWLETGRCVLHEAKDEASVESALAILCDLHDRRRAALGHVGRFVDARFKKFLESAARAALAENRLGLYWLGLAGIPVAAEIHFRSDRVSYAYQSGLDPEALDCEPGRLITIALLQKFIDQRLEAVDFLRGDEPYKAHFRAEPIELGHLRLSPPTLSARFRSGLLRTREAAKRWLRPEPARPQQSAAVEAHED
ncbi:MAG TPA: GNAT family N-acetyltransferase [Pirellulaceae bacterium]|jgi:CelD/BcsL family acetyltransferase involved in cellulose biosynthesis|nr:GNAT family N-acetyltransferase [Pirellulaceae bacterium]